jgi:hypothetical protein
MRMEAPMTSSEKSPAPSTSRVVRDVATDSATQPKRSINLTLSSQALAKAEQVAMARGTSISQLVDDLLNALPAPAESDARSARARPVRRLLGAARDTFDQSRSLPAYREFLYEKHGKTE